MSTQQQRSNQGVKRQRKAKPGSSNTPKKAGASSWFRYACLEASRGGTSTYKHPGYQLTGMLDDSEMPDDVDHREWRVELGELSQFARPRVTPLSRISPYPDYEGVWNWFCEHYPRFMKLIPSRRKRSFVDGVRKAFDDEVLVV